MLHDVKRVDHAALIGNFLPRQCGLATFTTATFIALTRRFPKLTVDVYAMNDQVDRYNYPPEVIRSIDQSDLAVYFTVVHIIEVSGAQAIGLQHEYEIFGGSARLAPKLTLTSGLSWASA